MEETALGRSQLDEARFREVLGHFPTGVTVVTTIDGEGPTGFTCQAFLSLSLDPPLVGLAAGHGSRTLPRIVTRKAFCVNILAEDQEALARAFAVRGGARFEGIAWRRGQTGCPVLGAAMAWVDCELIDIHPVGDHSLLVGAVVDLGARSGAPLVYYRGGFLGVGP